MKIKHNQNFENMTIIDGCAARSNVILKNEIVYPSCFQFLQLDRIQ